MTKPPLPVEHGSWALLACAFALGLAIAPELRWGPAALTAGLLLSVHMLRAAIAVLLSRRPRRGARAWVASWAAVASSCAVALVFGYGAYGLLIPASVGAAGMALHVCLARVRRLDRSVAGEMLAASLVALAGPVTSTALGGHNAWLAAAAWAVLSVSGGSGVVYVKMLLAPARGPRGAFAEHRSRLGRLALSYHAVLGMAALGWLVTSPGPASAWTATACAPLLVRALVGYRRLSPVLPRFTRVGIWETIWAAWFAAFAGAALRALDVR